MASLNVEQGQYTSYILTDEATQSEVVIIPERGGIITEWRIQGQDLFYLDRERLKDPKLSIRGGNPILFPICGNLPQDQYQVAGNSYTLVQHGFGRNLPWTVLEQSTDPLSLSVQLTSNDQTRSGYPFEFAVTYTYVVQGTSLEVRQRYENQGDRPMPFSVGFHPYFGISDSNKGQLQYNFPVKQWQVKETGELLPFEGLDFSQAEIDMAFPGVTGSVATVTDPTRSLTITVEYDSPFKTLVFWTVQGKDFYCLEPWSAPRNAMNTGTDLITLAPGEVLETWVRYRAAIG
ncbi:MAG: aldose epimerase [Prochlorothrix sp.]|nr:aldose epimerase [Prochlorothrix sp.]